jgi:CheY-like chemotaxis protein
MKRSATSPLRVLVIDGCADTRGTLCLLLRLWGHEAAAAADGLSALRLAEDFQPDVVLLDIVLPGLGGYEVARRLRQGGAPRRPWLVALTAQVSPRHVADALEADFDQFLAKPYNPEQLDHLLFSCALDRSGDKLERVGRLAQLHHGETHARSVVKEDAVLLASPDGGRAQEARAAHLEHQPARLAAAQQHALKQRGLPGVEGVVAAEGFEDEGAQLFQGGQRSDGIHRGSGLFGVWEDGETEVSRPTSRPYLSAGAAAESSARIY